jgi:hypothetical protein
MVNGCGDILKRAGPSATGDSDATILDVPNRKSTRSKVVRDVIELVSRSRHSPEPAVQKAHHRG